MSLHRFLMLTVSIVAIRARIYGALPRRKYSKTMGAWIDGKLVQVPVA